MPYAPLGATEADATWWEPDPTGDPTATGFMATQFGTPAGVELQPVVAQATGFLPTQFGYPLIDITAAGIPPGTSFGMPAAVLEFDAGQPVPDIEVRALPMTPRARFGLPAAEHVVGVVASAVQPSLEFGLPVASTVHAAQGIAPGAAFGTPAVVSGGQHASGAPATRFGTPVAHLDVGATGWVAGRWGAPPSIDAALYLAAESLGQVVTFGTPSHEVAARALHISPCRKFGTPVAVLEWP